MAETYRDRIYRQYLSSRSKPGCMPDRPFAARAVFFRDFVARYFPADRGVSVLELGCGHGALLHFLVEAGYRNLAGVDVSPEQVAAAAQLGLAGVEEGDLMEALAAREPCSVDVVVSFDVLEHFTKDEAVGLVDAVHRVLVPGGRWLLHVPNGESPFFGRIRYGDFTHELAFTRDSIGQLLLASGFGRVECFESGPVRAGLKGWLRWIVWKTLRSVLWLTIAAETGERKTVLTQNLIAVATRSA